MTVMGLEKLHGGADLGRWVFAMARWMLARATLAMSMRTNHTSRLDAFPP